jgi:methyl coenzyme M reductase beta subunit
MVTFGLFNWSKTIVDVTMGGPGRFGVEVVLTRHSPNAAMPSAEAAVPVLIQNVTVIDPAVVILVRARLSGV